MHEEMVNLENDAGRAQTISHHCYPEEVGVMERAVRPGIMGDAQRYVEQHLSRLLENQGQARTDIRSFNWRTWEGQGKWALACWANLTVDAEVRLELSERWIDEEMMREKQGTSLEEGGQVEISVLFRRTAPLIGRYLRE